LGHFVGRLGIPGLSGLSGQFFFEVQSL
jgi:hypothetical protein